MFNVVGISRMNKEHDDIKTLGTEDDIGTQKCLIRLSDMKFENEPFFLDFELFVHSVEGFYRILEICPPGPSAALDFYNLYCQHLKGDRHVVRILQSLCEISEKYSSIAEDVVKCKERSSGVGQKTDTTFMKFCLQENIEFVLSDPFILSELDFRLVLRKIWKAEGRIGQLTRKRKCQIYKLYCLHIRDNRLFFQGLFGISVIIPNGPYQLESLEQALIAFKAVPDAPFLIGPDACALAWFMREDFGIDHEFFKKLPRVLRLITSNARVQITCPKISRLKPCGSTHEYLQLACDSPSACKEPIRVQLRFPSEMLKDEDDNDVFTWVFMSTEDPGTYVIRNERWGDYLSVEKPEESGLCLVSTTLDPKDPRARFNLHIEGQFLRIIATCTASPVIIDPRCEQAYVRIAADRFSEAAIFLLKTV